MANLLENTSSSLADVYVARTGNSLKDVRDWMADEKWFLGKEAVDAGFADNVVENLKVAASAAAIDIAATLDITKHKFKKAPAALIARQHKHARLRLVEEVHPAFRAEGHRPLIANTLSGQTRPAPRAKRMFHRHISPPEVPTLPSLPEAPKSQRTPQTPARPVRATPQPRARVSRPRTTRSGFARSICRPRSGAGDRGEHGDDGA